MKRIAITGAPKAGKTRYADRHHAGALHVDLLRDQEPFSSMPHDEQWSAISQHVADRLATPGPVVIEGVQVPRALRKALRDRPDQKPVDEVLIIERQGRTVAKEHSSMAKGAATVLAEIRPALEALGVEIRTIVEPEEEE